MKTISVIGSGYVGVTTAAIAANAGFKVHLIDIDPNRIKVLQSGKSFFFEEGINPLIKTAVDNKTLLPSTSYDGVAESEIIFSCVGTPDNPDGSSNLSYVHAAAKTSAKLLKEDAIYVQKSTVPVGTGAQVRKHLPNPENYVSNPEFLREGTAVGDTLFFDRIVVGGPNTQACTAVVNLYKVIESNQDAIAKLANITAADYFDGEGEYITTNLESAELIKVTANAFLALKISFANSIAKLADKSGANVVGVMDGVGADRRIGRAFLNAGRGYGGGCFPKDVSGLISSAKEYGVDLPIMKAATDVNESMSGYVVQKTKEALGELKGKQIAVLGLAFKAGTSDARKSPSVKIANLLVRQGAHVTAYDPEANEEASEDLHDSVSIVNSALQAVSGCEVVIIGTDWPEFKNMESKLYKALKDSTVVDAMNCLDASLFTNYIGIGVKTNTVEGT